MNASIEVLRITRWCYPNFVWNKPAEGGGIYWHSQGSYLLKDIAHKLPPIEFITTFSDPLIGHPTIQTIYDGNADLSIDDYQHTYERYQYVDFAYPSFPQTAVWIWSSNKDKANSKILDGVFDKISSLGIFLSFLLLATLVWISRGPKVSTLWGAMDTILRSLLRQPPRRGDGEPEIRASGLIGQLLLLFASFFLSSMYVSVVMSLLSVDTAPPTPNTLEDLAIRFPEMKIYVPHRGVALEVLKISSEYPLLEKRLETVNLFDLQDRRALEVFSNIINGTHIETNVWSFYINLDEDIRCQLPPGDLAKSSTPLAFTGTAPPVRRGSKWLETFNSILHWLEAFGLRDNLRDNGGFFSNQTTDQNCAEGTNKRKASFYPAKCFGQLPPKSQRMTFQQIWPAIACWLGFMSLAATVFVLELGSNYV